jgi:hypothetical protein
MPHSTRCAIFLYLFAVYQKYIKTRKMCIKNKQYFNLQRNGSLSGKEIFLSMETALCAYIYSFFMQGGKK